MTYWYHKQGTGTSTDDLSIHGDELVVFLHALSTNRSLIIDVDGIKMAWAEVLGTV